MNMIIEFHCPECGEVVYLEIKIDVISNPDVLKNVEKYPVLT